MLRATRLLRELAERPSGATVAELAKLTTLDRTVTHRLLVSLSDDQLVEKQGSVYYVGAASIALAAAHVDHSGIRYVALPYLMDLHIDLETTPWIVAIGVGGLGKVIFLERLWKRRTPLSIMDSAGTEMSLERSALGRCLLAYGEKLGDGQSPASSELIERLALIRDNGGIETSLGEIRPGAGAVACAVLNGLGDPVAGVVVSGPDILDYLSVDSELAEKVSRTARAISRVIAGHERPEYRRATP